MLQPRGPCQPFLLRPARQSAGYALNRIHYVRRTGIACFHFDSEVPTPLAKELAGQQLSLMGGTSNLDVIRSGTPEAAKQDVAEKLDYDINVIGPECAVPLDAPYGNMSLLWEFVHQGEPLKLS